MAKNKKNIQDTWEKVKETKVDSPFEGKVIDSNIEGQTGEPYSVRKNLKKGKAGAGNVGATNVGHA